MVFIIQMLISIRIKMKQGMLIAVAVMNVIVLFAYSNNVRQRRRFKYHSALENLNKSF